MEVKNDFISVIILNYNGKGFLKDCLDTISNQSVSNYEIILVDNNSTDGSIEFAKANYPHVKLIECKENYGFAKGNNIGVKNARGRYIILLNNDTKIEPNFIEALFNTLQSKENCGIAAACTYPINNIQHKGDKKDGLSMLGHALTGVFDEDPLPFLAPGFALIFDRDKIPRPFDDDYFIFYEDNYVSWLSKLKGYNVAYTSKPLLWHYGSGTTGKRSRLKVFHGDKNRIMNLLLFYDKSTLTKLLPLILLTMAVAPLRAMVIYRGESYVITYLKSYAWILTHLNLIMEKRRNIQSQRKVSDEEILNHFTYKISDGKFSTVINAMAKIYCKLVGIKTFDLK